MSGRTNRDGLDPREFDVSSIKFSDNTGSELTSRSQIREVGGSDSDIGAVPAQERPKLTHSKLTLHTKMSQASESHVSTNERVSQTLATRCYADGEEESQEAAKGQHKFTKSGQF